ncbi:MAG: bifunctional diaminohydroxyphosphoribosylaminopyrimidine deaminase/5-amino-6-(5-phosphoribosylamino)uracil reductase RibD [Planctomycetota bacterium]
MPRWTTQDAAFMSEALHLALQGQGRVEPNPMVGCVLVKGGRIVGRGYHQKLGGPHAEIEALRDAGKKAAGSTAYVTLEPCNHHGRTPPCTDALIAAKIARVVTAIKDPNPQVTGNGLKKLRAAGIHCDIGPLESQARELAAPFITFMTSRRPYVILKWAQSIDGKIATRTGDSKWITSLASRRNAHALRARVDAIIVGVGTILADDPDLTARHVRPLRKAARIIIDPQLRTPLSAKVVRTARQIPTFVATRTKMMSSPKARRLAAKGCELLAIPVHGKTLRLRALLTHLHDRAMTNVLVEGGGRTLGGFVEQKLADEAHIFIAPKLIGGETAPGPLRNLGPGKMTGLPRVVPMSLACLDGDLCYTMRFA